MDEAEQTQDTPAEEPATEVAAQPTGEAPEQMAEATEPDTTPKQTPAAPPAPPDDDYQETDVFLWANNLVPVKEELDIDLFLFNKNFVVYRPRIGKELTKQLQPLLVDELLDFVLDGVVNGLVVRSFEEGEGEERVLQRARLRDVGKAQELLNWLQTQEKNIEYFVEEEHDFKRLKGVVARIRHKELPYAGYVVKMLPGSMVMKGNTAWLLRNGSFVPFDAEGSLRVPADNQLLILDQDIYAFNPGKLDTIFGYNAKKYGIAQKKMEEIQEHFTFSFADELTMEAIVHGKKALVNKLQKINPEAATQDELLSHAEELGIELMTDTDGAIIIMDAKDLTNFINLLNDDYVESQLTGLKYEIKSKRILKISEEAFGEEVV